MTTEEARKKERRRWSPDRRARDQLRRAANRERKKGYLMSPLTPSETKSMVREELAFIHHLQGRGWVKLWSALNHLSNIGGGTVWATRPKRQAYLALLQRMISENKILRHRKSNTICLALWLDSNFVPNGTKVVVPCL